MTSHVIVRVLWCQVLTREDMRMDMYASRHVQYADRIFLSDVVHTYMHCNESFIFLWVVQRQSLMEWVGEHITERIYSIQTINYTDKGMSNSTS